MGRARRRVRPPGFFRPLTCSGKLESADSEAGAFQRMGCVGPLAGLGARVEQARPELGLLAKDADHFQGQLRIAPGHRREMVKVEHGKGRIGGHLALLLASRA